MPTTLDLSGLDRIRSGFWRLVNPDATDLMVRWMTVIDEDNRKGVLAGLDKDGIPLAPVTYRPLKYSPIRALKPNKAQRGGMRANAKKGGYLGLGAASYGNLTSAEYRRLGGPPLAPREQFSRVVTNLRTGYAHPSPQQWEAFGYWEEVVSVKRVPFLRFHFEGIGQKRRDLRGVRPDGVRRATEALQNWARLAVRQAFGSSA